MRQLLLILLLGVCFSSFAQTRKLLLDKDYQPTNNLREASYFGTIEKKKDLWYRELYYTGYRSLASQGWFQDKDAKIPHGGYISFHGSRQLKEKGTYEGGKKEGTWLMYYPTGALKDSFTYKNGFLSGVQYGFYMDGNVSDSMNFDGSGNGTQVSWHPEGIIFQAGWFTMDTVKKGRWKYYDTGGKLKATEDYSDGKLTAMSCFDTNGTPVDTALCTTREAIFPGERKGWQNFLMRNLNASVPIDNGAKPGRYTVFVTFSVERNGEVTELKTLTHHGFGMEQEVLRLMKASPKWKPELRKGIPFRSLKVQPVTFIVSEE